MAGDSALVGEPISMTMDERAKAYAARIRAAISKDQVAIALGRIRTAADLPKSNLADELEDIGEEIDTLVFIATKAKVPESYKEELATKVGEDLKLKRPQLVRIATKAASVQNYLAILKEMQEILEEAD